MIARTTSDGYGKPTQLSIDGQEKTFAHAILYTMDQPAIRPLHMYICWISHASVHKYGPFGGKTAWTCKILRPMKHSGSIANTGKEENLPCASPNEVQINLLDANAKFLMRNK